MLPDSDHNQQLAAPDTLTGAVFNYEWRKNVVGVLERELPKLIPQDATEAEIQEYDNRISELINDIYTQEITSVTTTEYGRAYKTNTQALTGGTEATILWNAGDHDASPNVDRVTPQAGIVTLSTSVFVSGATAFQLTLTIVKNNSEVMAKMVFANTATAQRMNLSTVDISDGDDYYTVRILTNQNTTIQSTETAQLKWVSVNTE
jgi:hypothetical protein